MKRALLLGAVLAFGCKKDAKECAALLDKTEQRITDELRWANALTSVDEHIEVEKREAPKVAIAAWPFEPGLAFHIDTNDGAVDSMRQVAGALTTEACIAKAAPIRIYLLALPSTPTAVLAEHVAWVEAAATTWKKPIEILMPVKLPEEVRYYDWPEGTPSEVKQFGREILDSKDDKRIENLQQKIRLASAGCSKELAKRIEEASDAEIGAIHYAMPKGLRDCGCNGVDAHTVIGLYHVFDIMSSDLAWVRLSATQGIPLAQAATVGELVAGTKTDARSILRVPNAKLPTVLPLQCESLPATSLPLRFTDEWEKAPADDSKFLDEVGDLLHGCTERYPLERSAIADIFVQYGGSLLDPGEGETMLQIHDRTLAAYDLEQCMRTRPQLPNQELGWTRIEMYVPGKPSARAPR